MVNSFQFTRAVRLPDAPKDAKELLVGTTELTEVTERYATR